MHLKQVLGLLATSAVLVVAEGDAAAPAADSKVEVLTKETFDDFVNSNDLVLAECTYHEPATLSLPRAALADICILQSTLPGADTASLLPPSTRRPLPL